MAVERNQMLSEWCEQRDLYSVEDIQEVGSAEPPAAVMVPFLIDSRRKEKIMCRQLCALDFTLNLLESLESPDELLNSSCPKDTGECPRAQWKALKNQYREETQRVQDYIVTLQENMEQAATRREKIAQLFTALERKMAEAKEKEELKQKMVKKAEKQIIFKTQDVELALGTGRTALRLTEQRIADLKTQMNTEFVHLECWMQKKDFLQRLLQETLGLTGCKVQWVGERQLDMELTPQVCQPSLGQMDPLRLSLTWTLDGIFNLEMTEGTVGLLPESIQGPITCISTALLEVMQCYLSQGEILAEIQGLHKRFAIDWRPAERQLDFLKSASAVCRLHIEVGYPSTGRVSLLSVHGDKGPLTFTPLQPSQKNPSLTQWLEYLSTCPYI